MTSKKDVPLLRWENEGGRTSTISERFITDEELESLGITMIPNFSYEWGGYRYSNLKDAISAAKRTLDLKNR